MSRRPLAADMFCGKGGWSHGLLATGWDVIGFDIADMGGYPAQLVLQDVATIDGRKWRGKVQLIVASPPCTEYSYMAMPWSRAKQIAAALRGDIGEQDGIAVPFPEDYAGSRTRDQLTALFRHCFRIAAEAECPIVVENVRGAIPWVGPSKANFGSFHLWGDVDTVNGRIVAGRREFGNTLRAEAAGKCNPDGTSHGPGSWFAVSDSTNRGARSGLKVPGFNFHQYESGAPGGSFQSAPVKGLGGGSWFEKDRKDPRDVRRMENGDWGIKQGGNWWHDPNSITRQTSSRSAARREASARIAMIPRPLSEYIGRAFFPR